MPYSSLKDIYDDIVGTLRAYNDLRSLNSNPSNDCATGMSMYQKAFDLVEKLCRDSEGKSVFDTGVLAIKLCKEWKSFCRK